VAEAPATAPPTWDLWGARLARAQRPARDNFLAPGDRSGLADIDFIVWIARCGDRLVVVDTGFDADAGRRRGRTLDTRPADAVRALGLEPDAVRHVVLTHLHYDHAGNIADFPAAQLVVQGAELAYATGSAMRHPALSHFFEADDVTAVVRRVFAGTVQVADGDVELAPGLELYRVGGHTRGMQVVRVHTERGWVVLASDAAHYFANLSERNPFPALVDVEQVLDGYARLAQLASSPEHIVPGHDPEIFHRYRPAKASGEAAIVALHHEPARADPVHAEGARP
jgi:glyoxylase-like metal-dependent hydrolase (beta-lactamase superfamily II)